MFFTLNVLSLLAQRNEPKKRHPHRNRLSALTCACSREYQGTRPMKSGRALVIFLKIGNGLVRTAISKGGKRRGMDCGLTIETHPRPVFLSLRLTPQRGVMCRLELFVLFPPLCDIYVGERGIKGVSPKEEIHDKST